MLPGLKPSVEHPSTVSSMIEILKLLTLKREEYEACHERISEHNLNSNVEDKSLQHYGECLYRDISLIRQCETVTRRSGLGILINIRKLIRLDVGAKSKCSSNQLACLRMVVPRANLKLTPEFSESLKTLMRASCGTVRSLDRKRNSYESLRFMS